jgi:lipid II:glycine glycyltransferase (peptidoglycan interpeptide bridge formation enzyme)
MEYSDLTAPYGYSGPLIVWKNADNDDTIDSLLEFRKDYFTYARERNYVSEFIRFHPVFGTWRYFHMIFDIKHLNDTIVIDLTKNIEELNSQLSKNTRRYLRKSCKEFDSVTIVQDPSEEEFEMFLSLYEETMRLQNASGKYFFDGEFIRDHFRLLDSLFIYCRNPAGETGSIGLFFRGENILHYHLGATNYRFSSSPLRTVIWEAVKWAKNNGCTQLHLGGGLSHNDSLFAFKKGFSERTLPFYIGKIIFDEEVYNNLVSMNPGAAAQEQFFPRYRVCTNTNIVE